MKIGLKDKNDEEIFIGDILEDTITGDKIKIEPKIYTIYCAPSCNAIPSNILGFYLPFVLEVDGNKFINAIKVKK